MKNPGLPMLGAKQWVGYELRCLASVFSFAEDHQLFGCNG